MFLYVSEAEILLIATGKKGRRVKEAFSFYVKGQNSGGWKFAAYEKENK